MLRERGGRQSLAETTMNPGVSAVPMMWLSEGPTRRTFLGQRWLEFTGRSRADEAGEGWIGGVHPDDTDELRQTLEMCAAVPEGYQHDYRLRQRAGDYRWVREEAEPHLDEKGVFVGFAGATRDVQIHHESEEQLAEQMKALEGVDPAVIATDREGRIVTWSQKAEELYGWKASEVVGRKLQHLRAQAFDTGQARRVLQQIGAGDAWSGEMTIRKRDGSPVFARGSVAALRDASGDITGAVLVSEDASRLRSSQGAIARFGRLLDQSPNEIYVFDADTLRFLQVNRGAIENLGYSEDELLELTPLDVQRDLGKAQFDQVLEQVREGLADQVTYETEHARKDGTVYPVEVHISLARDEVPPVFVCIADDISERRAIQEQLQEAYFQREQTMEELVEGRQRLEDLVDNLPGVVWEVRGEFGIDDFRVTYVSPQLERMLGYTWDDVDEAEVESMFSIIHSEDRGQVYEAAAATYEDGEPRSVRFRWIAADGHALWVQSYYCAVKDDSGKVVGLRGVNLDITEQHRAEELLNFSIEAGRILASSLDYEWTLRNVARLAVPRIADWCAVNLLDENGTLRQMSVAHVNPDRVEWVRNIQRRGAALRPPEQPSVGPQRVVETGESQLVPEVTDELLERVVQNEPVRKAIQQLGMRSYMCVPMTRRGQVLGAMTFVAAESGHRFDEVDLRTAEHLARRAATAIDNAMVYRKAERERARFTTIVASVDYGVCQVDAEGRIEHLNPAAESMLAQTQELMGADFHELVHGALDEGYPCIDADCPVTAVLRLRTRTRGDITFVTGQGTSIPVRVNCSPIIVGDQTEGAVIAFEDIAERLEAEQRKDDFLAFASHELRNPLTPILGLSRWFERHVKAAPERYDGELLEVAETLVAEGRRMANIVDVFLDLSRIESNRLMIEPTPLNLCALLEEEADAVRSRHKHLAVEMRIPVNPCTAVSDEGRLRQVVSNLLENAAKYGGENPHITVALDEWEQEATIRVRDDGPGIALEDQERIFERFYRAETSSNRQGFGVGLFLTREIVAQLGGRIGLDSRPGEGAEFRVTIPYRPSPFS